MLGEVSEAMSSLTWDSAAWIYSVIIGVVLARYFIFISNLLQEPKAIKLYYPYLAFTLANILHLYWSWYTGKRSYTMIEGHTLSFALRTFMDAVACISALIIVPQDKLLEDFFDMKPWFMQIKRMFFFISVLQLLALTMIIVLFYLTAKTVAMQLIAVRIAIFIVIMIPLNVGSAFSKNDYYLSFHGTLMVVLNSYNLSKLSGSSEIFDS